MISIDQLALFLSAQGFLLTLLFFSTKLRALQHHPNFYLSAFIAIESLRSYFIFILLSEAPPYSPPPTILLLFFLSGPAIYLYARQIRVRQKTQRFADILHLLPLFVVVGIYIIASHFVLESSGGIQLASGGTAVSLITIFNSLITLFYYLLSYRAVVGGGRRDPISVRLGDAGFIASVVTFLKILIVTQCVELAFNLLCLLYPQTFRYNAGVKLVNTTVVFYYIVQKVMRPAPVQLPHQESPRPADPDSPTTLIESHTSCEQKEKYAKSGLDKERSEELWLKLTRCLERQKLYLDVELHLNKLAAELEIRPQLVSQIINAHSGKNFYEFICEYRINAAKLALSEQTNARRKLIDIAWSSGFSSHSAFFYHFKRHTGMTPSSFRQMRLATVQKLEARRPGEESRATPAQP